MNKQALSLAVFIAGAYPAASNALGLGDIESSSHLNQPLRAKIELLSGVPADASQLKVRLASPDVFNRVGVARPEFLDSLQFTPTVQGGKPVILVTSSSPIQEPFVNFLLEVSWPQGQLLKEYTVMLDPPVLMQPGNTVTGEASVRAEPKATGTVRRPATQPAVTAPPQANAGNAPANQSAVDQSAPRQASGNRTYRVRPGDTLFRVASRLQRPGISNDQMMMALFRANPNAFIDKNLNSLRSGVALKAPTVGEANNVSRAEARRQIRQHNADWRELRQSLAKNTVPQKATDAPAKIAKAPTANKAPDKARLEVLGAKSGDAIAKDAAVAASNAKLSDLEKQLSLTRESMTARQKENDELKSRVTDLESMLSKKNRLIALRNDQLAGLQKQLSENGITVPPLADMNDAGDIVGGKAIPPATNLNNHQNTATKPTTVTPATSTPSTTTPPKPDQGKDIQTHMANVDGANTVLRSDTPSTTNGNSTSINPALNPVKPATGTPTPPTNTVKPATGTPTPPVTTPATTGQTPASMSFGQQNVTGGTPPAAGTETPSTATTPATPVKPVTPITKPPVIPVAPLAQDGNKKPAPVFADQNKGDGDILELLTSPLALQIGAGSLALLLLLWLLSRRRKPEDGGKGNSPRTAIVDDDLGPAPHDNDLDDDFDLRSLEDELDKAEARDNKQSDTNPFGLDGDNGWDDAPKKSVKSVQQTIADNINNNQAGSATDAWQTEPPEEDDCLTEANVYIAYGLYQQAESELKKCIERNPDKLEYHHKLLECYFVANNREAFDRQAEQFAQINGKGKDELWKAVVEWGRKISPDNKLYQNGQTASNSATAKTTSVAAATIGGAAAAALATAAFASDAHADVLPETDEFVDDFAAKLHDEKAEANQVTAEHDDFDFDLDSLTLTEFDTAAETQSVAHVEVSPPAPAAIEPPVVAAEDDFGDLGDLDFDDIDLDKLLQDEDDNATVIAPPTSQPVVAEVAAPVVPSVPVVPVSPPADQPTDAMDAKLADEFDDFDFDLMLDDEPPAAPVTPVTAAVSTAPAVKEAAPTVAMSAQANDGFDDLLDLDFADDFADFMQNDVPVAEVSKVVAPVTTAVQPVATTATTATTADDDDNLLDFMLDDDLFTEPAATTPVVAKAVEEVATNAPAVAKSSHVANLNLHLDNSTGINRILPKDTFYAPTNGEDQDWLGDIDDALSFLDFPDEEIDLHEAHISTKLDLARAYLDMGDIEGARSTLEEVMVEGNDDQRREAEVLLHQTG